MVTIPGILSPGWISNISQISIESNGTSTTFSLIFFVPGITLWTTRGWIDNSSIEKIKKSQWNFLLCTASLALNLALTKK